MAVSGTLGSKLFISDGSFGGVTPTGGMPSSVDTIGEFTSLDWVEVGLIENMGEFGRIFDLVTFQAIADGRTYKLKGGYNDGNLQLTLGQDISDTGQALLYQSANSSTQDQYGFRIELNDEASDTGGPTTYYFRGLIMGFRSQLGSVNSVVRDMTTVEINSNILYEPAAELYDRFITGGSLTHYELFRGSDTEASFPVISANALVMVSGNDAAGTGVVNGSQLSTDDAYNVTPGALVVEARIKISAALNAYFFFGLSDQKAALEEPIISAGVSDTITTNATDAVGFMFDTRMATDNVWLVGVVSDVDQTSFNSATAPSAGVYKTYRIEISSGASVTFYVDGIVVGVGHNIGVSATAPLYTTLYVSATATASRTLTVDYLYTRQDN